jgi:hypothetical protein
VFSFVASEKHDGTTQDNTLHVRLKHSFNKHGHHTRHASSRHPSHPIWIARLVSKTVGHCQASSPLATVESRQPSRLQGDSEARKGGWYIGDYLGSHPIRKCFQSRKRRTVSVIHCRMGIHYLYGVDTSHRSKHICHYNTLTSADSCRKS